MKSYVLIGTVLTLAGIGSFAGGALVLSRTIDRQIMQNDAVARSERACREQVVRLGKVTPGTNESLEVDVTDISDPRTALAQATSILAMCPTKQISDMCLGTGCAPRGAGLGSPVHMIIKLAGVKK